MTFGINNVKNIVENGQARLGILPSPLKMGASWIYLQKPKLQSNMCTDALKKNQRSNRSKSKNHEQPFRINLLINEEWPKFYQNKPVLQGTYLCVLQCNSPHYFFLVAIETNSGAAVIAYQNSNITQAYITIHISYFE